ncbi:MAG: rod-binding protein [Treponemataceae bacterium]
MNISEVGSMYLKDRSLPSFTANHPSSGFANMMKAAADEESGRASAVPDVGRPLGAAANSGAKDKAHAKQASKIDRTDKLYEQCREMETFLIKNLLSGLRKTVEKSELSDGGFAGQMYEDMLWDKYAESMSKNAGLGLADQAYIELSGKRGKV